MLRRHGYRKGRIIERVPMRWHAADRAWLLIGLVMRSVVVGVEDGTEDESNQAEARAFRVAMEGTFLTG